jgi:hypothetical protein
MQTSIYLVAVLLVLTKLLDVASTLQKVNHASEETNPIARQFMIRFGAVGVVWMIFLLAIVIIGLATALAMGGTLIFKGIYLLVGVFVSAVQAAVAHSNWQGGDNLITKYVRAIYVNISLFIQRISRQ